MPDVDIRGLERAWLEGPTEATLLAYIIGLLRAGRIAEAMLLIAENLGLLGPEARYAIGIAYPQLAELFRLLIELARAELRLGFGGGARALEIERAIERLLASNPELQQISNTLRAFSRIVVRLGKIVPAVSAFGPIVIGLLEVLVFFVGGLLLPASKMGELSVRSPFEALGDELYDIIMTLYFEHARHREDYPTAPSGTKLRELANEASYLLNLIDYFLGRYRDDPLSGALRQFRERIQSYVNDYSGYGPDTFHREPVTPPPPPPPAPPLLIQPRPTAEHPHTMERPMSYEEWQAAQQSGDARRFRNRILDIRKRIRELKRKQRDSNYDYERTQRMIEEFIDELMRELERLRAELDGMGQDTGEDLDEPLDPPATQPEPPPWPLGHDTSHPLRLYVNPKTGKQRFFSDPPEGDEWEPLYGDNGEPRYHWGWLPRVDPLTGRILWGPGWMRGPAPARNTLHEDAAMLDFDRKLMQQLDATSGRLSPAQAWHQLREAQREGVNVATIAHRHGVNWSLPLGVQSSEDIVVGGGATRLEAAAMEAGRARVGRRGTIGWGAFLSQSGDGRADRPGGKRPAGAKADAGKRTVG